jgi:hypothetical protein
MFMNQRTQVVYSLLTEDGQLHLLNVISGEITKSVKITEPYSMDGHWRDPRPRLAVLPVRYGAHRSTAKGGF